MLVSYFAAAEGSGEGILGFSPKIFIFQLITFLLVFLILKKFAFNRIISVLEKRRIAIEKGVALGEKMEKRQAQIELEAEKIIREARQDADKIIDNANKESRELISNAEKSAKHKADLIIKEADVKIGEEAERAKRAVEKDIVGLVSEATEAVVHEKVDAKKDAVIIDKVLKKDKK